jgi:hypothetical protein
MANWRSRWRKKKTGRHVSLVVSQRSWHSPQFKVFRFAFLSLSSSFFSYMYSRRCRMGRGMQRKAQWFRRPTRTQCHRVPCPAGWKGRPSHRRSRPGGGTKKKRGEITTQLRHRGHCRTSLSLISLSSRSLQIPM